MYEGFSGRVHNQMATISIVTSVNIFTIKGAVVISIKIALINIMILANHLALRGTVPCSRQFLSVCPYLGWLSNQASICGHPFEAAQAAKIRNTVVGIPGKIAPMKPSTTNTITRLRQNNIFIPQLIQMNLISIYVFVAESVCKMLFSPIVMVLESVMTNLFEPWLSFKHPLVRQLAFAIASPNILKQIPQDLVLKHAFELHPDIFWQQQFEQYHSRLEQLDLNPNELTHFIAKLKSTRLGLRFEYLMWFWLQDSEYHHLKIIGHSIQIIDGRHTVGELDFLILNQMTQHVEHWEVALKFYLSEPSLLLKEWYGLNRSDTLFRKLNHFSQKQFQFDHIDLNQQQYKIDRKFAVLKGQLYLPETIPQNQYTSSISSPIASWVNPARRIGQWGYHIRPDFYRVERQEWICTQQAQSSPNAVWWYDGLYRNYQTLEEFMFRQAEYIHSSVKIL